jgi:hypothetical protein
MRQPFSSDLPKRLTFEIRALLATCLFTAAAAWLAPLQCAAQSIEAAALPETGSYHIVGSGFYDRAFAATIRVAVLFSDGSSAKPSWDYSAQQFVTVGADGRIAADVTFLHHTQCGADPCFDDPQNMCVVNQLADGTYPMAVQAASWDSYGNAVTSNTIVVDLVCSTPPPPPPCHCFPSPC